MDITNLYSKKDHRRQKTSRSIRSCQPIILSFQAEENLVADSENIFTNAQLKSIWKNKEVRNIQSMNFKDTYQRKQRERSKFLQKLAMVLKQEMPQISLFALKKISQIRTG